MNPPDPWVLVGRIGKAHGLDGSVRVWPEADLGEIFDNQVPLKLWVPPEEPSQDLIPVSTREAADAWVVHWDGIEDREATLPIRNGWIVAKREDLPEAREDHAYWDDLIGARVVTRTHEPVGVVIDILEVPLQTVLEIECEKGERFLLPLSQQVDAELEKSGSQDEPNRLVVSLPEGIVEATSIELNDRPRKRDRRGSRGKETANTEYGVEAITSRTDEKMLIDFVTVFPEMFTPLDLSIIGKAKEKGLVHFRYFNPRDFTDDPHRNVDDTQFGGSEGMVMAAPPLIEATEAALNTGEGEKKSF